MTDDIDPVERRALLRQIAAYRALCQEVKQKANWGLVFGGIMLGVWYFAIPAREQFGIFGLIYLGLAALEFTAGLWNKFSPSPEGILVDGLVLIVFGGANLARQGLIFLAGAKISPYLLLFGGYWLYQGYSHVQSYFHIRSAFPSRPSAEHLRWFDSLLAEVRQADPDADPDALDLPTRPPLRAKLLGDMAVLLSPGSSHPMIVGREDVEIELLPSDPNRESVAVLYIENEDYGKFPIDDANWRNYTRWKGTTSSAQPIID